MLKLFQENINRYFPGVRGAVLLIVLPAFVVVIIHFIDLFGEIVITNKPNRMMNYEKQFAKLKKDIPKHVFVNYVTDNEYSGDYFAVRYVLIPSRIVRGLNQQHNYLIAQFSDPTKIPEFKGYKLKKNYGKGIMLFLRSGD